MADSAARQTTASRQQSVGDVDYYYSGKVNAAAKAAIEAGDLVPVWIREDKGADYWGAINGQGFVVRSSEGMDRPRMVPEAIAGNLRDGREQERAVREEINRRQREMARPLAEMPEYVR